MVPDAEFTSYYGRPIIKSPTWKVPDVPLYLYLGGAAGVSASLAAPPTSPDARACDGSGGSRPWAERWSAWVRSSTTSDARSASSTCCA
jgi:hypothetical protein